MRHTEFDILWSDFSKSEENERSAYARSCVDLRKWKEYFVVCKELAQMKQLRASRS